MSADADHDRKVVNLVAEALVRRSPAERSSWLQQACEGDADLLREVIDAVEWEERMGEFLRIPAIDLDKTDGAKPVQPRVGLWRRLWHRFGK